MTVIDPNLFFDIISASLFAVSIVKDTDALIHSMRFEWALYGYIT